MWKRDPYIYDKETYERDVSDSLSYLRYVKRDLYTYRTKIPIHI